MRWGLRYQVVEDRRIGALEKFKEKVVFGYQGPVTVTAGPYANTTVEIIYNSVRFSTPRVHLPDETEEERALGEKRQAAAEWIEAENVFDVRAVLIEWFDALNDGTANDRYPDPTCLEGPPGEPITEERADKFVEVLEDDMLKESGRFRGLGKEVGPGFPRLEPHARLAFMQAVWQVMKTKEQIKLEAIDRIRTKDLPDAVLQNSGL